MAAGCGSDNYQVSALPDAGAADAGSGEAPDFPSTGIGSAKLSITGIEPASGPFTGGTRATVRGSGFAEDAEVRIGGRRVEPATQVVDGKGRIEVIVPAGEVGDADVQVQQGDERVTLRGGFHYNALRITPEQGAAAGGTLIEVEVSGAVFDEASGVELDGAPCTDLRVLGPKRVRCRTPKHAEGRVDVSASGGGEVSETLLAKGAFEYIDSADTDRGGLSGGPIDGSLDVTVVDAAAGLRLPGAHVLVGNDPKGPYQGLTDARGAITFSGDELRGPVTVHASLKCYERSSIVSFDARSATVFLVPILDLSCMSDAEPGQGHGVLGSYVSGELVFPGAEEFNVNAWDIVPKPAPGEVRVAYVFTTQSSAEDDNPPTDGNETSARIEEATATRGERGFQYRIFARPAGLAVYALAGLEDTRDGRFTAYVMGVARNVVTSPGDETLDADIDMELTLDRQLEVSLEGVPTAVDGAPNDYAVSAYVDLGGEGVIVPQVGRGLRSELSKSVLGAFRFVGQPAFLGTLADASYEVVAGYFTRDADVPYTMLRRLGVRQLSAPNSISGFVGIPQLVAPQEGAALPADRTLRFDVRGDEPDMFLVKITGGDGNPAWMQVLPGSAREVPLPDLSTIDELADIPSGFITWEVTAVNVDDFDYDEFQYAQLSKRYITASAGNAFTMRR